MNKNANDRHRELVILVPWRPDGLPHGEEVSVEALDAQCLARRTQHLLRVVPVDGPTARLGRGGQGRAVHHPIGDVLGAVIRESFGNRRRKLRATAKGDAEDARHRRRDRVEGEPRMPLRRNTHALDQCDGLVQRESLGVVVMGKFRQALVHQFYSTAVEERPIGRHRHEYRPTAVIRYPDDAAVLRHDGYSHPPSRA